MPTPYTLADWRDRYRLASASRNMLDAANALSCILTHLGTNPEGSDTATRHRLEQVRDQLTEASLAMRESMPSDERGDLEHD